MAFQRFVLTATVVCPGGAHLPGSPGAGRHGPAGPGSAVGRLSPPVTCVKGTVVILDPGGEAYRAIGPEHLRPFTLGRDEHGRGGALAD
jgi:hypothetical protein